MKRRAGPWLVASVAAAGVATIAIDAGRQLFDPLPLAQTVVVEVERGAVLNSVLEDWTARGILERSRQARYLGIYARVQGQDRAIKPGEYELQPGMRAVDLTGLLVSGHGVLHELQFIEGRQFADILTMVLADARLEHAQPTLTAAILMQALGAPELAAEGRFYPDTYRFSRHTPDLALLRQAYEMMQKVLAEEWAARDPAVTLKNADEALILASIVERETGLASERAEISGVFTRRLHLGMRLQTDPTVIYGLGSAFDGNLRRRDLERDTPFNTYTRHGLPPTPICLPGRDSIHAALHPAPGDTLYFVARGDGSHQFSATVEQHNAAVRKFQLKRRSS